MEHIPGTHAALLLFKQGLGFEAVVRGLSDELELSAGAATSAAAAALTELLAQAPRR
jgi:hypothetical protein